MSSILQLLERPLHDLYTARYTQVTPLAMLLYNHMLTFSNEVDLFWNRKWSFAQLLFFMIRYPPAVWEIFLVVAYFDKDDSPHVSEIWGHQILVASGVSTIYTVHAILILRLYGLYGSKRLMYALWVLLGLAFGAELYVSVTFSPTFLEVDLGPTIGHVCVTDNTDKMSFVWIPILTFEIVVFLLALYKGIEQFKSGAIQASRLMRVMIRDSFLYFFLIVSVDIANLIAWIHVRATLRSVTFTFTASLMSIIGSQMLMNIRLEARPRTKDVDTMEMASSGMSSGGIEFGRTIASSDRGY